GPAADGTTAAPDRRSPPARQRRTAGRPSDPPRAADDAGGFPPARTGSPIARHATSGRPAWRTSSSRQTSPARPPEATQQPASNARGCAEAPPCRGPVLRFPACQRPSGHERRVLEPHALIQSQRNVHVLDGLTRGALYQIV